MLCLAMILIFPSPPKEDLPPQQVWGLFLDAENARGRGTSGKCESKILDNLSSVRQEC